MSRGRGEAVKSWHLRCEYWPHRLSHHPAWQYLRINHNCAVCHIPKTCNVYVFVFLSSPYFSVCISLLYFHFFSVYAYLFFLSFLFGTSIARSTEESWFDSQKVQEIWSCPKLTLGPTQTHIQRVPGSFSSGIKRSVREADHLTPSSVEAQRKWSCDAQFRR